MIHRNAWTDDTDNKARRAMVGVSPVTHERLRIFVLKNELKGTVKQAMSDFANRAIKAALSRNRA